MRLILDLTDGPARNLCTRRYLSSMLDNARIFGSCKWMQTGALVSFRVGLPSGEWTCRRVIIANMHGVC